MSMKHTLVVVDVQRDFYHPTGSLYVDGGLKVVDNIAKYIINHSKELDKVIFTLDWHPYDEAAYSEPEINWPMHCAQNSEGAGIANKLIEACWKSNIPMEFFYKGQCVPHTEYGAFERIGTYAYEDGSLDIITNNRNNSSPIHITTGNAVICGIAGDYCVMNTIKNLKKYKGSVDLTIFAYMDGICSIDKTNKTIINFCKNNDIVIVND